MAQRRGRTLLDRLHSLLVRRLGGRSKIPRGGPADRILRAAVKDAMFAGACTERSAALDRIRGLKSHLADPNKVIAEAAIDAIIRVPVSEAIEV